MKTIVLSILIFILICPVAVGGTNDLKVFIRKIDYRTIVQDYLIINNEIKVVHGIDEIADEKYSKMLKPNEVSDLIIFFEMCRIFDLKKSYMNQEVEDGYQVIYEIEMNGNKFKTRTYNVYQPTMISICKKINSLLPEIYHIRIPSKTEPGIQLME